MPRAASYDEDDEPIEGYRLLDFLGKGQFGEVWKAVITASGKEVALKFIDLSYSPAALKELRALKLTINLRHSHLIPLNNAWLKDFKGKLVKLHEVDMTRQKGKLKELIIEMGLGEKSLAARLKEVNPDGTDPDEMQGIPTEELLEYMIGAAKGIDFLNQPDHKLGSGDGPIIHCDIKPDNMMIVSGEVQIADCGVAVALTENVRITKAAFSAAYGAPESIANKPVPGTDQYSLAISYYELRTGRLPFPEQYVIYEILAAHAQGRLNFSSPLISEYERTVLKWATSLQPKSRYPTCSQMVKQLDQALNGMAPLPPTKIQQATKIQPAVVIANPPSRRLPALSHPVLAPMQAPSVHPPLGKTDEPVGTIVIGGTGPELVLTAPELSNPSSAVIEALERNFPLDDAVINLKPVEVKPAESLFKQRPVPELGSGHDLPKDPNDPLGDSHTGVSLDRALLGLTMTPNPPSFPLAPAPETVKPVETRKSNPHPRRSNPRETPLPPPPEPQKDPSWLVNAKQEEVKSRSTPNVAWNRQIPAAPPNTKPLGGIIAGVLVAVLLGGGGLFVVFYSGRGTGTSSTGDGGTTLPTVPDKQTTPPTTNNGTTNGGKAKDDPLNPVDVANKRFEQALDTIVKVTPVTTETNVTDILDSFQDDGERKSQLLKKLVEQGSTKELQSAIATAIATPERLKLLDPDSKRKVQEWYFHAKTEAPAEEVRKAFVTPKAVNTAINKDAATDAVTKLRVTIQKANELFGAETAPPDDDSNTVNRLATATEVWQHAVESPTDANLLQKLHDTVMADKPPSVVAALAFEYLRLSKQPIRDLKGVRDRAKTWNENIAARPDQEMIDKQYQTALGKSVRNALNTNDPNWAAIIKDCDTDHANGWANAAALEAKLCTPPVDFSGVHKLLNAAKESKYQEAGELRDFEKYLNACHINLASGLANLYQSNPTDLLTTTRRKTRAAEVLFEAAKKTMRQKLDPIADFAKNPYAPSGDHVNWLQLADKLTGHNRSDVAIHCYLVKADAKLLDRVNGDMMLVDEDLNAALAFFALKAKKSETDDQKLIAYSQAARCAIRVMDRERKDIKTDVDEDDFNLKYANTIHEHFLKPAIPIGNSVIAEEAQTAKLVLKLLDYQFDTYEYRDKGRTPLVLADELRVLYDKLPDSSPYKMEALACHAYATLRRFFNNKDGDLSNPIPDDSNAEATTKLRKQIWLQMISDAESATKSSSYFAHLTMAWAGGAELGSFTGIKLPLAFRDFHEDLQTAISVAKHYENACKTMGDRKRSMVWATRSAHLFLLANAVAKLGGDSTEVKRYLADALISTIKADTYRSVKRYSDANQRGLILEDLAWLSQRDKRINYELAIQYLNPANGVEAKGSNFIKYRIDIGRCIYRAVVYDAANQDKLSQAKVSLEYVIKAVIKDRNDELSQKLQAKYWLALIELQNQEYAGADNLLKDAMEEKFGVVSTQGFVTLSVARRAKLALDQMKKNENDRERWQTILKDCIVKLDETKHVSQLSSYSFLADYFRGMLALMSNDGENATKYLQSAFSIIQELQQGGKFAIDEPFVFECLEAVISHKSIPVAVRRSAYESLKNLRSKFAWLLVKNDADRIDKLLEKKP